jgi:hypothetical protein
MREPVLNVFVGAQGSYTGSTSGRSEYELSVDRVGAIEDAVMASH